MPVKIPTSDLYADYLNTRSVWKTGKKFGLAGQTVHERFKKEGLELFGQNFTEAEDNMIRQVYSMSPSIRDLNLRKLAQTLNRHHTNICRRAKELGLTSATRKHTAKQRDATTSRQLSRIKSGIMPGTFYTNTQKGWAEFSGGRRYFLKSGWEFKYADYLEMLLKSKGIAAWEYEPETFWFLKIARGTRSYTPDFKVTLLDGSVEYHEVKGWLDAKSKVKLKRMRIYHPKVKMVLIQRAELKVLGLI